MAQTHPTATRNAIARAVTALVDAGGTTDAGRLVLYNRDGIPIAALWFAPPPAFMAPVDGIAEAYPLTPTRQFRSGEVPARFEVQSRDGHVVWRGRCPEDLDMGDAPFQSAGEVFVKRFFYRAGV